MSDRPMHYVVDIEKGTAEFVPFTDEEIQQRELDAIEFATRKAEEEAEVARIEALKASARTKLVAGETLTEEEAALLI